MSVNYNRVLRVETQIEASVLKRIEQNDGVYLPPDVVVGRHVFFAVDNVDFCEDTPDGKRTFHGTAMAIYQRTNAQDQVPDIAVDPKIQSRSIKYLPESITDLLECPAPPSKLFTPVYREFHLFSGQELPSRVRTQDYTWLLGRSLSRVPADTTEETREHANDTSNDSSEGIESQPVKSSNVPVWSAYNSMLNACSTSRHTTAHCSTSTRVANFANCLDAGPEYISEGGRTDEKNCRIA